MAVGLGKMALVCAAALALALALAAGAAAGPTLAAELTQLEARALRVSHPVCFEIAKTWWNGRLQTKIRALANQQDELCQAYNNAPEFCNHIEARANATGLSPEQLGALCSTVGAKSKRCLGSVCNSLNEGSCNVQSTSGKCVWIPKPDISKWNAALVATGRDPLPGFGCYRNPCDRPGYDEVRGANDCAQSSVPGFYQCTWCAGAVDKELLGLGMGCQATVPTTAAACAPVNNRAVPKSTVYVAVAKPTRCMCRADKNVCEVIVNESRGGFKPRYG
jgi:hypothetical protein